MLNTTMNIENTGQTTKSTNLYDILRNRFKTLELKDVNGDTVSTASDAVSFSAKYLNTVIALDDSTHPNTLRVNYSSRKLDKESDVNKAKWTRLIAELRKFATTHGLDINIGDFEKTNLNKREGNLMNESKMFGTSRKSYQEIGDARLIINHSRPINMEMPVSRTHHIESIYIENVSGERFRYPLKHLNGARAIANHINHGGNPYDAMGTYIIGLSEELSELRRFNNYTNRSGLSEALDDISSKVGDRIEYIKEEIGKLQRNDYYTNFSENFSPIDSKVIPDELVNQWVDALTVRTFNEELKTVFPYIYRLVDHKKPVLNYEDLVTESETETEDCTECSCDGTNPMDEYEENLGNIADIDYGNAGTEEKFELTDEIVEYIKSFYDDAQGKFPIGEERVKLAVDRKFGDKAGQFAAFAVEELSKKTEASHEMKRNWFDTLNGALEAEGLIDEWPVGKNMQYGETVRFDTEDGRHVSIYRSDRGTYERPVVYNLESRNVELDRILKLSNIK